MFYVGADVSKGRWFTVKLEDGGGWEVDLLPNITSLWEKYRHAARILLDIPIGLPDRSRKVRSCDKEARRHLGMGRRSSVFPAPCRRAVYSSSHRTASEVNKQDTGRGLSIQAWCLASKIREVDEFLLNTKLARRTVREIHPELCFSALNAGRPMKHRKKSSDGVQERKDVLASVFPISELIFDLAKNTYPRKDVGLDDILDALVGAVTAFGGKQGLRGISENRELDSLGFPMQMFYRISVACAAERMAASSPATKPVEKAACRL